MAKADFAQTANFRFRRRSKVGFSHSAPTSFERRCSDLFGPSSYENFFVLDCQSLLDFESLRSQLIAKIIDKAFGFEKNSSQPREFCVLVTSGSEKERSLLRSDDPFVSTNHCVVHFLKEPTIEVWRGHDERACTLLARAFSPFIAEHDITISSDWGDDLTSHYRKYPWELFLGR